jgi:DNA recombination protein RmuC
MLRHVDLATAAVVTACLTAGAAGGWLAAQSRSAVRLAELRATLRATRDGEERLERSLRALSFEATAESQEAVSRAVAPLHEVLRRYEQRVAQLERDRTDAYAELRTVSWELRDETKQLVAALRAPQVRGRWGEHQLRRIVEAAGMLEHCDFDEQVTAAVDGQGVRPDLVVRLHGGRTVVVDAKAPFQAYLTAMEARDEAGRDRHLSAHAAHLRRHVDTLAAKSYWAGFAQSPEFVVLFMPADPFLDAALQHDPTLLEHAFARNVVLATPATLVALLRTVAYAWRQEALARNAATVQALARDLYGRLSTMTDHLAKLGGALGGAVGAYNRVIGSMESRVLVSARKLAELGVADQELPTPAQVELAPRRPQIPEPETPEPETPEPETPEPETPEPETPEPEIPEPAPARSDR